MKPLVPLTLLAVLASSLVSAPAPVPTAPPYPRPLVELNTSYFPFHDIGEITPATWAARR